MESRMKKLTCRALIVSMMALSFQTARAGLISPEQAAASTTPSQRALVLSALDRAEVVAQLEAYGIDPNAARERVATMNDQEVQALAQDIQAAPAAGASGWAIVAVVLVAAAIWYYAMRK